MSSSKNLVVIPTYNERENVESMTDAVMSVEPNMHVLYVDDASPDGTADIIKELQKKYQDRIHLLSREGKQGLGTAYIAGFKWGLENGYDYIFEMDCDFSHNPKDLPRLLSACQNGADVAVGSRYCKGGRVSNWPIGRILMSFFASVYVRMILWINIKDTTAGFKCYRREVLETMNLEANTFKGYAFQIFMKYMAIKRGFKVVEVPITFIDRLYGVSKMSTSIFKEAFYGVWKMRNMKL